MYEVRIPTDYPVITSHYEYVLVVTDHRSLFSSAGCTVDRSVRDRKARTVPISWASKRYANWVGNKPLINWWTMHDA